MATTTVKDKSTLQSNIKQAATNMQAYSLFLGGLNVRSEVLAQFTPLKTGYARIFLVKMPVFMQKQFPNKTKTFKHLVEYGFVGVDGIQNLTMDFEQVTGGYAARQFDVATVAKDETNEITVKMYEFSGSPTREYIDMWMTGVSDPMTGIAHYHGAMDLDKAPVKLNQANHTMEAIYVQTDASGRHDAVEYACMIANMMPKQSKKDHFNYEAGTHSLVQTDVPFTAVKYESRQINDIAEALVKRFALRRNFLSFQSGYIDTTEQKTPPEKKLVTDVRYMPRPSLVW